MYVGKLLGKNCRPGRTRDQLNRLSAASGQTVDAVIQRALRVLEVEERRRLHLGTVVRIVHECEGLLHGPP